MFGITNKRAVAHLRKELALRSAQLSFQYAQTDQSLLQALIQEESPKSELFLSLTNFQRELWKVSFGEFWTLQQEIDIIRQFIGLTESLGLGSVPQLQTNLKHCNDISSIRALTLFPLLQNAMRFAFHSTNSPPIKINIICAGDILRLEVSNQTNPYLTNQAATPILDAFGQGLDWFYPEGAELICNSNSNRFKATLILKVAAKKNEAS